MMWWLQQRDAAIQGHIFLPGLKGLWDGQLGVSCHFFSSFFLSKYMQSGYEAVRRWTLPRKLQTAGQVLHAAGVLECELLVAPYNIGNWHWVLVVADIPRRRILYLDPAQQVRCRWWGQCHYTGYLLLLILDRNYCRVCALAARALVMMLTGPACRCC